MSVKEVTRTEQEMSAQTRIPEFCESVIADKESVSTNEGTSGLNTDKKPD